MNISAQIHMLETIALEYILGSRIIGLFQRPWDVVEEGTYDSESEKEQEESWIGKNLVVVESIIGDWKH